MGLVYLGSEEFSHFFVFFRFSSLFRFFFVFLRFSSFFFVFRLFSWNKGKRLQFTGKMGNFTPTPSAPTPFGTPRVKHGTFWTPMCHLSFSEPKLGDVLFSN